MMNAKAISVDYAIPQSKPTTAAGLPPRALLVKASTCKNVLVTSLVQGLQQESQCDTFSMSLGH
jgi:hypothetical protein